MPFCLQPALRSFHRAHGDPGQILHTEGVVVLSDFYYHFPHRTELVPQTWVIHPLSGSYRLYLVHSPLHLTERRSTSFYVSSF
jgi:hypothetical protein